MIQCIIAQRHNFVGHGNPIYLEKDNSVGTMVGILHRDAISCVPETVSQLEAGPILRYHRIDRELIAAALESQNFFEPDAIRPSRRARVPCPATAPDMAGQRVNVARYDVGLDLVALAILLVAGMLNRIQHPQESDGSIAIALAGKSHGHPRGGMRVLAAAK